MISWWAQNQHFQPTCICWSSMRAWWASVVRLNEVAGWLQMLIDGNPSRCVLEALTGDKDGLGYQRGCRQVIVPFWWSAILLGQFVHPPTVFLSLGTWSSHHFWFSLYCDIYLCFFSSSASSSMFFIFLEGLLRFLNFEFAGRKKTVSRQQKSIQPLKSLTHCWTFWAALLWNSLKWTLCFMSFKNKVILAREKSIIKASNDTSMRSPESDLAICVVVYYDYVFLVLSSSPNFDSQTSNYNVSTIMFEGRPVAHRNCRRRHFLLTFFLRSLCAFCMRGAAHFSLPRMWRRYMAIIAFNRLSWVSLLCRCPSWGQE